MRALGAPRRFVFVVAWGFTASLMIVGIVAGLAGGFGLSFGISWWLAREIGVSLQPQIGWEEVLMASVLLVVGLVLAVLPAWRLQRLSLAGALKDY